MCEHDGYVCGSDLTDDDFSAYDRGELVEWRRAPTGEMWYRRAASGQHGHPLIQAIPADDAACAGDDFDDEPIGLTDAERDALVQWADCLQHAGDDPEGAEE